MATIQTSFRVTIDQSGVYAMIRTFEENLYNAELFAAKKIENRIRYQVFDEVVHRLGERAGGFPRVYQDHLAAFMKVKVPIIAQVEGGGYMSVSFNLEGLGDYNDLELGAHHNALIYEEPGSYGVTSTGKAKYNPHPQRVSLPYKDEPLMNEADRRQKFWEEAIVEQQTFITNFRKGTGFLEITDAPTFEEVAAARVLEAWIPAGKAPQWLWLENGFYDSKPEIKSVDFTRTIENISLCIGNTIYEQALVELVRLAEAAGGGGVGVGRTGRIYQRSSGRFVSEEGVTADTSHCLGNI